MTIEDRTDGVTYHPHPRRDGTFWPVGLGAVAYDQLTHYLAYSARDHARRALGKFTSDIRLDQLDAAASIGCAVELLAKSYLARIEPALLAERVDRNSILILTNKAHLTSTPVTQVRTLSADAALTTVKHLLPGLPYNSQADGEVLQVRNAALHMGLVSRTQLRAAVVTMVAVVEALLPALDLEREPFWGHELATVATEMLNQAADELRRVVAAKLAAARLRLVGLLGGLDDAGRKAVLAALNGRQRSYTDHEEPQTCPVCKQNAWLLCGEERGPLEWDYDDEGFGYPRVDLTAWPFRFECGTCELELEGDELRLFDEFPQQIELEPDTDPREAGDWEPDFERF